MKINVAFIFEVASGQEDVKEFNRQVLEKLIIRLEH